MKSIRSPREERLAFTASAGKIEDKKFNLEEKRSPLPKFIKLFKIGPI